MGAEMPQRVYTNCPVSFAWLNLGFTIFGLTKRRLPFYRSELSAESRLNGYAQAVNLCGSGSDHAIQT